MRSFLQLWSLWCWYFITPKCINQIIPSLLSPSEGDDDEDDDDDDDDDDDGIDLRWKNAWSENTRRPSQVML